MSVWVVQGVGLGLVLWICGKIPRTFSTQNTQMEEGKGEKQERIKIVMKRRSVDKTNDAEKSTTRSKDQDLLLCQFED